MSARCMAPGMFGRQETGCIFAFCYLFSTFDLDPDRIASTRRRRERVVLGLKTITPTFLIPTPPEKS
jgi:uncharacterized metal-binding protein